MRGQGQVSRAEHHFRNIFLLLQHTRRGHSLFALFPPSISLPAWFSQIRKPGFSFAGPDCSSLLPSHIEKPQEGIYTRKSLQRIPSLVPVEHWVCSSPAPCSRKAAFNLTSCKDSCASPSSDELSLLLPAQASLHACISSTLGMSQPCFWWHMGFPWPCNPVLMLEAAPLSPLLVGLIPASSSTRQISQHRDISPVIIFS